MADRKSSKRDSKPDILFISGSPRNHTCVALIDLIERGAQNAGAKTQRFVLSKKHIDPCVGCGGCNTTGNCAFAGKAQNGRFADDYLELKAVLERVDAVAIVAPLYFAGPPAQLKALYDRMQPYWVQRYLLGYAVPEKRSAQLFVVGGGGDAHGYAPLVGSTKSAMAVAGFNLEKVNNFIGFTVPKDVPAFPHEEDIQNYSHIQLAQIKRVVVRQEGFVQRALDAGGAFARFVVKKKQANDLAEQLAKVEAELEALRRIGDAEKPEHVASAAAAVAVPGSSGAAGTSGVMSVVGAASAASAVAAAAGAAAGTAGAVPSSGVRGVAVDRKGDLRAEIDLEYSNLISRTPRDGEAALDDTPRHHDSELSHEAEGFENEELLQGGPSEAADDSSEEA
jgi:multimeric flavodoxin WrbA